MLLAHQGALGLTSEKLALVCGAGEGGGGGEEG
jgi:hypothetical protein